MLNFDENKYLPPREPHHPHYHNGEFPREKPRYTMTEEVEYTARQMKETIERLLRFEQRVKQDVDDLMRQVTSDNVLYKTTLNTSWQQFLQEVKNEINVFEGNVDATISLFQKDIESNYATLSEDVHTQLAENLKTVTTAIEELENNYTTAFAELKITTQEQYEAFSKAVNERIDWNNDAHEQAFADYQQKLTTDINMFEATVNNAIATFQESCNNTITVFKETWEQIITQRLDRQDAKLDDAELYMRSNLTATVTTLIGDMHANGDFVEIIEGEVFNDLESSMSHVNVKKFGACSDGSEDATANIKIAIMYATENNLTLVLEGVFLISDTLSFTCNVNAENATFIYDGAKDRPAILVSDKDKINVKLGDIIVSDASFHGWENDNFVGLQLVNLTHSIVSVRAIENFTIGLETKGYNSGFGWNEVAFTRLRNNRIQHHIVNDGENGWHNANTFNGGDIAWGSGEHSTASNKRYSVKQSIFNDDNGVSCNSNIFNHYYLEGSDSTMNHTAIEILFATYWIFNGTRIEHAFSATNKFIVIDCDKCVDVSTKGSHTHACQMVNTTYYSLNANIDIINYENLNIYVSIPEIFYVDFLHKFYTIYSKNYADLPIVQLKDGYYHIERTSTMKIAGATNIKDSVVPYFYCPNDSIITNADRYLGSSNGTCMAVWLSVEKGTTFKIHNSSNKGTIMVRCFDSDGNIIVRDKLISCGDYRSTSNLYSVSKNYGLKGISILDEDVAYIAIAFESFGAITIETDSNNALCKWLPPTTEFNNVCLFEQYYSDVKPISTALPIGTSVYTPSGTYYLNSDKVWTLLS